MRKIYILGEARGAYRIQNLIKNILDNRKKYRLYYDDIFYHNRFLRYLKSLLVNIFVILRSDVVYVCTLNVDINIFYELFWAKILGKKIIVDFYVSVYDTVVLDRKWFKENTFLAKLAKMSDRIFLSIGTITLFLDDSERQYYCQLANVDLKSDYIIVPLGIEENKSVNSKFVFNDKKEICVCWWGSYMPLHGIEKIIGAAEIIKTKDIPVKWYFYGNDDKKGQIYIELVKKKELENICFFNNEFTFNNGKLEEFLINNCDISLGPFGDSEKAKTVTSNKLIEACAMKSIVLTGYSKGIKEYFDENDSLFMCNNDEESIANAILNIYYTDKKVLQKRIEKQYRIFKQEFTVIQYNKRMGKVLDEI